MCDVSTVVCCPPCNRLTPSQRIFSAVFRMSSESMTANPLNRHTPSFPLLFIFLLLSAISFRFLGLFVTDTTFVLDFVVKGMPGAMCLNSRIPPASRSSVTFSADSLLFFAFLRIVFSLPKSRWNSTSSLSSSFSRSRCCLRLSVIALSSRGAVVFCLGCVMFVTSKSALLEIVASRDRHSDASSVDDALFSTDISS